MTQKYFNPNDHEVTVRISPRNNVTITPMSARHRFHRTTNRVFIVEGENLEQAVELGQLAPLGSVKKEAVVEATAEEIAEAEAEAVAKAEAEAVAKAEAEAEADEDEDEDEDEDTTTEETVAPAASKKSAKKRRRKGSGNK